MKRCVLTIALLALAFGTSSAQETPRRTPSVADYTKVIHAGDDSFKACVKLLTGRAAADECALVLVRSEPESGQSNDTIIEAVAFRGTSGSQGTVTDAISGYERKRIATRDLEDRQNADALVEPIMKSIMDKRHVPPDATVVVSGGSKITASMLIRQSQDRQFIIEQESLAKRFGDNLQILAQRKHSGNVSIFDYAPQSEAALAAMGGNLGSVREWRSVSEDIATSVRKRSSGTKRVEPRTLAALKERLRDPEGGVVVIYGHSDGQRIFLDTEEGVVELGAVDIRRMGEANGGRLPPIMLLNCRTRSVLAPAFLAAGSPMVITSDRPLPIVDIATFVDRLVRRVHSGNDVIDSFFDVQKDLNLAGMRAVAQNNGHVSGLPVPADQSVVLFAGRVF
jgi:hypothetical protein